MISVVIPTYNESKNIGIIIPKIDDSLKNYSYQIVIVDDDSPDGTGQIADGLSNKYPVKVIHRRENKGYGEACKEGFRFAIKNSDYIITMDCDLSHDPTVIPEMIKKAEKYDVIIGSRYIKGGKIENWGLYRKIVSKVANVFTRFFLGISIKDCTSGFRFYKSKVLKIIDIDSINSNGYSFLEEILYRCYKKGFKISEVPITFKDRINGKSKLSKKEIFKFIITLIKLRTS